MAQDDQLSLVTVAAAAASGVGVLGFVTFAGGVVLWRRFDEMGLPGDQAVALVPKSELIATGADFLAPAFGFTVLTVLGLVIVRLLTSAPTTPPRPVRRRWAVAAGVLLAAAEIVVAVAAGDEIGKPAVEVLVLVAAVTGAVVGLAYQFLQSLAAVALITFLCAGTFWVARAYDKTSHAPKVLPMAYSRSQPGEPASVESGYLIAETSDRIWFASLPQADVNELREFPRSETDDIEVGQLVDMSHAHDRAALFVANLCDRLKILAAAAPEANRSGRGEHRVGPVTPAGCQ